MKTRHQALAIGQSPQRILAALKPNIQMQVRGGGEVLL